MMAEMLAVYGGLTWEAMLGMDARWFFQLHRCLPVVEARRQLSWLHVLAWPHLDEDGRRSIFERLMRESGYAKMQTAEQVTDKYEAGWAALRSMGVIASPSKRPDGNGKAG